MRGVRFAKSLEPLLVPLEQIQQHPDNPNNGDLDALVESIQMNGFTTALSVDANTGFILAGNHRYQALHQLGATHAPVIWIEEAKDGGKRLLMADNRTGQKAKLDERAALSILQELAQTPDGLVGTGWEDNDIALMMNRLLDEETVPAGGFGEGPPAMLGIYQVIVTFQSPDDRDEAFADLSEAYEGRVRTSDL